MAKHDIVADRIQSHSARVIAETPIQQRDSIDWNDYTAKDYVTKEAIINAYGAIDTVPLHEILVGASLPVTINMLPYNVGLRPTIIATKYIDGTTERIQYDVPFDYIYTDSTKAQLSAIKVYGHDDTTGINLDDLFISIKK